MNLKRKRVIISVGGTIVLLSMIGFVMYPLGQGIVQDYQVLLATKKEAARIARDIQNITEFATISSTYEAEFSQFNNLFVDPDNPIPFIEFLEGASQTSQLELTIVARDQKQVKGDPWSSMDFQLTLEGSYPSFVEFTEKLEAAPYLVELRNMTMRKFRGSRGVEVKEGGEFTVLVKAYVQ